MTLSDKVTLSVKVTLVGKVTLLDKVEICANYLKGIGLRLWPECRTKRLGIQAETTENTQMLRLIQE